MLQCLQEDQISYSQVYQPMPIPDFGTNATAIANLLYYHTYAPAEILGNVSSAIANSTALIVDIMYQVNTLHPFTVDRSHLQSCGTYQGEMSAGLLSLECTTRFACNH
jgi:hypothetical protein